MSDTKQNTAEQTQETAVAGTENPTQETAVAEAAAEGTADTTQPVAETETAADAAEGEPDKSEEVARPRNLDHLLDGFHHELLQITSVTREDAEKLLKWIESKL